MTFSAIEIKFLSAGTYTLTANFTLPDNTTHSVTKTVTVKAPVVPNIAWRQISGQLLQVLAIGIEPQNPPDTIIEIYISNPSDVEYQWQVSRYEESWVSSSYTKTYNLTQMSAGTSYIVSCRSRFGNEVSAWSNELFVTRTGVQSGLLQIDP